MNGARLVWHQFRYDQKTFWRDPAAVFFTVALPLIFLFIFVSIFGNESVQTESHGEIKGSTYYVPGIVTLGLISATFVNLAISLTSARERGLLKRLRKTPLPAWVFMAARVTTSIVVTLLLTIVLVALGRVVYGVAVPTSTLPGALLALVVGAAAFCALGFALSGAIPSENAAPPITNAIILPLYFISGVFIPESELPAFMRSVGEAFPVKHVYEALLTAFDPTETGPGVDSLSIGVVAAWGVAGALVALRTFRWFPRSAN
jgi:ABC-2 type transport system permease protein